MREHEALKRLEARGGWDEGNLNDFAIVEGLFEQYQDAMKALAYVDACFEGDEESVTRRLHTALGVAQAWEVKNEDARYVASLIRDVLPPLSDASGVVRAALADSIPATEPHKEHWDVVYPTD